MRIREEHPPCHTTTISNPTQQEGMRLPLSFQQIRREARLTSQQVADQAGVPLREAYLLEIGGIVPRQSKKMLVRALATLTKQPYRLQDFEPAEEQPTLSLPLQRPAGQRGRDVS